MKQFILTKKRYTHQEVERIIVDVALRCGVINFATGKDFSKAAQEEGRKNRFVPLSRKEKGDRHW